MSKNFINSFLAIQINTQNLVKTLVFLLLGMVLMFVVMTIIYLIIKLLNATDKHEDSIKAFFIKSFNAVKRFFSGRSQKGGGKYRDN